MRSVWGGPGDHHKTHTPQSSLSTPLHRYCPIDKARVVKWLRLGEPNQASVAPADSMAAAAKVLYTASGLGCWAPTCATNLPLSLASGPGRWLGQPERRIAAGPCLRIFRLWGRGLLLACWLPLDSPLASVARAPSQSILLCFWRSGSKTANAPGTPQAVGLPVAGSLCQIEPTIHRVRPDLGLASAGLAALCSVCWRHAVGCLDQGLFICEQEIAVDKSIIPDKRKACAAPTGRGMGNVGSIFDKAIELVM